MTALPSIEFPVYPNECDAFGHLNAAAFLGLLERARWEALARGPGMDLFQRSGVWPAVRKSTVEYRAPAYPGDVLRIDTVVTHRGTISVTLRHTAKRVSDDVLVAEAQIVFVCIDHLGRATPIPEAVARFFGPRSAPAQEPLRVEVGGAALAVEVRGEGAPILFVHGFPLDHTMWRHQLAALARWKRVAPDLRGAGASSAPQVGYSIARYAEDLVAVLDVLGIREATVCGLSMGGYIVFELLRRAPDRVRAVILANTKAEADSPEARRGRDDLAVLVEGKGREALAEQMLPKLLAPVTLAAQPELVAEVREMIRRCSISGIAGALRAIRDRPDSTDTLRAIRVPTLFVAGSEDQISPPSVMKAMAALVPGARFAVIAAAGHLAPLEQPLVTSRVFEDFLERCA